MKSDWLTGEVFKISLDRGFDFGLYTGHVADGLRRPWIGKRKPSGKNRTKAKAGRKQARQHRRKR